MGHTQQRKAETMTTETRNKGLNELQMDVVHAVARDIAEYAETMGMFDAIVLAESRTSLGPKLFAMAVAEGKDRWSCN